MAGSASSLLPLLILVCLLHSAVSDMESDRSECAPQLTGIATCLPFVEGNSRAPTPNCCDGFKDVAVKSPKCLCILVKYKDSPNLGFTINATLAFSLPRICQAHTNISDCPRLLNLPPDSKEAQIFKQIASDAAKGGNTVKGNSPVVSSPNFSFGGKDIVERAVGLLLLLLVLPPLMALDK